MCPANEHFVVVVLKISLDDTDNDINDMVLVILKPRSLTAVVVYLCRHTYFVTVK